MNTKIIIMCNRNGFQNTIHYFVPIDVRYLTRARMYVLV